MSHHKQIQIILEITKSDRRELTFHHDHVEGRQIREAAGVPLHDHEELFSFRDGHFHHVGNDQTVPIREREHFILIPKGAIHYSVNDEPQWTREKELTPIQIMTEAGIDPQQNYLVEIKEHHHQESFKDRPTAVIHMHDGLKFITHFMGPKPVSNC